MTAATIQLTSRQMQLLAINAMFEQARRAGPGGESCVDALRHIVELGDRAATNPHSVRCHELNDAEAEVLYHSLLS